MTRTEKTVFISYRRTNAGWALAIYQNLTANGYDTFFDYLSLGSGAFDRVILDNIRARAHFIVLLTPSALERCHDPNDWLRREIEAAIEHKRNIVPLVFEGFDFGSAAVSKYLTGKMATLKGYNALTVPPEYFEPAMIRLREAYLNVPLSAVLHPLSDVAKQAVEKQQVAASNASPVSRTELGAYPWIEKGYEHYGKGELDAAIGAANAALLLKPDFAAAFELRGRARKINGDVDRGKADLAEAIRLDPSFMKRNKSLRWGLNVMDFLFPLLGEKRHSGLQAVVADTQTEAPGRILQPSGATEVPEGIYLDPQTELMWTKEDNGRYIFWNEANQYANLLRLGGYSDWRLPTIEELEKLYDPKDGGEHNIRKPLKLSGGRVWSSTKAGRFDHWYFRFKSGKRYRMHLADNELKLALCVRRSGE